MSLNQASEVALSSLTLTEDRSSQPTESGEVSAKPAAIRQQGRLHTVSDWLKAVYEVLDDRRLALLEPRKLVPPGGYHSPKCVAAGLDCILRINECKTD